MKPNRAVFMAMIFVAALGLRALAVSTIRGWRTGPSIATDADGVEYRALALHLVSDREFAFRSGQPTSSRPPGFPLALSLLYATCGTSHVPAYMLFCTLGALSCVLTYRISSYVLEEYWARIAAILAAFYPPHIYFATRFDAENLFVPLLALGLWIIMRQIDRWSSADLALAGMVFGCAALVRPFALLLLPILVVVLTWAQRHSGRFRLLPLSIFSLAFVAVVGAWTVRNFHVHHHAVLITTNGGSAFQGGNNTVVAQDVRRLGTWVLMQERPERNLINAMPDEVSRDRLQWALGWAWVRQHPSDLPLLLTAKVLRFLGPDVDSPNRSYVLAQVLFVTPYLVLFVIGLILTLRRPHCRTPAWMVFHGTILASLLTAVIFWSSPRFRDANMPVLMAYAAFALKALCGRAGAHVARGS